MERRPGSGWAGVRVEHRSVSHILVLRVWKRPVVLVHLWTERHFAVALGADVARHGTFWGRLHEC